MYTNDWNTPFDSSLSHILNIDSLPDIFILPTDTDEVFALNIEDVLVINPKRLGTFDDNLTIGGSYAKIVVPSNTKAVDSFVQIKRI